MKSILPFQPPLPTITTCVVRTGVSRQKHVRHGLPCGKTPCPFVPEHPRTGNIVQSHYR